MRNVEKLLSPEMGPSCRMCRPNSSSQCTRAKGTPPLVTFYIQASTTFHNYIIPVVLHKAVKEVSKTDNYRRGELLMCGWQSESTDGPKSGRSCAFWSGCSRHLTTAECNVVWRGRRVVVVVVVEGVVEVVVVAVM